MRRLALTLLTLAAATGVPSCRPDFAERESFVDRIQVLAVRIEPPEAKPGEAVVASLLVASPAGAVDAPAASWAFCTTPKLLTENGAVSAACYGDGVAPVAAARGSVSTVLPMNGCFDFGPETRSADVRPRDPDVTGGFFQPLRARLPGDPGTDALTAFGFARLACNLPLASADLATAFAAQYHRNLNPMLLPLTARLDGDSASLALDSIPRGASVVLRASWRAQDAEPYALFDPRSQSIQTVRESMRVSWFANAGSFDHDRTGRTEDELDTFTENAWSAPREARATQLWIVLRDSRGGVAFSTLTATTR